MERVRSRYSGFKAYGVKIMSLNRGPLWRRISGYIENISGDIKPVLSDDGRAVDFLSSNNAKVLRYGKIGT